MQFRIENWKAMPNQLSVRHCEISPKTIWRILRNDDIQCTNANSKYDAEFSLTNTFSMEISHAGHVLLCSSNRLFNNSGPTKLPHTHRLDLSCKKQAWWTFATKYFVSIVGPSLRYFGSFQAYYSIRTLSDLFNYHSLCSVRKSESQICYSKNITENSTQCRSCELCDACSPRERECKALDGAVWSRTYLQSTCILGALSRFRSILVVRAGFVRPVGLAKFN